MLNLETQQHKAMADKGLSPLESMSSIPLAQSRGQNSSRELKVKNVVPAFCAACRRLHGGRGAGGVKRELPKMTVSPNARQNHPTLSPRNFLRKNSKFPSQRFVRKRQASRALPSARTLVHSRQR